MRYLCDCRFGTSEGQTQAQANLGTLPRLPPAQKAAPTRVVLPRYWVGETEVNDKLKDRWDKEWLLGWRDICRSSDERTIISSTIPRVAVGDKYLLAFTQNKGWLLQVNLDSFALDYCARQKFAGISFKYFLIKQLPVLAPGTYDESARWATDGTLAEWLEPRVQELSYTARDMQPFASSLRDDGPPLVWDEKRRRLVPAELDAAFFHLYGIVRDDVDYIMDSFRAFRNNNPERFSRTKTLILAISDAITVACGNRDPHKQP